MIYFTLYGRGSHEVIRYHDDWSTLAVSHAIFRAKFSLVDSVYVARIIGIIRNNRANIKNVGTRLKYTKAYDRYDRLGRVLNLGDSCRVRESRLRQITTRETDSSLSGRTPATWRHSARIYGSRVTYFTGKLSRSPNRVNGGSLFPRLQSTSYSYRSCIGHVSYRSWYVTLYLYM